MRHVVAQIHVVALIAVKQGLIGHACLRTSNRSSGFWRGTASSTDPSPISRCRKSSSWVIYGPAISFGGKVCRNGCRRQTHFRRPRRSLQPRRRHNLSSRWLSSSWQLSSWQLSRWQLSTQPMSMPRHHRHSQLLHRNRRPPREAHATMESNTGSQTQLAGSIILRRSMKRQIRIAGQMQPSIWRPRLLVPRRPVPWLQIRTQPIQTRLMHRSQIRRVLSRAASIRGGRPTRVDSATSVLPSLPPSGTGRFKRRSVRSNNRRSNNRLGSRRPDSSPVRQRHTRHRGAIPSTRIRSTRMRSMQRRHSPIRRRFRRQCVRPPPRPGHRGRSTASCRTGNMAAGRTPILRWPILRMSILSRRPSTWTRCGNSSSRRICSRNLGRTRRKSSTCSTMLALHAAVSR